MSESRDDAVRTAVRLNYGAVARRAAGAEVKGCCQRAPEVRTPCCAPEPGRAAQVSCGLGYSEDDLAAAPEGANLGLGCGNPTAIAALKPGERVLDLGSGGGFDCFLAARQVGAEGRVVGVDMTSDMIELAQRNAAESGLANVEFRLGQIEALPVADSSIDVILSNCVVNLSPDKAAVFREAFRVLAPGGRLSISDIVATAPLPDSLTESLDAISGCIGGAESVEAIVDWLMAAGFVDVRVEVAESSREAIADWVPGQGAERFVASAAIEAHKPADGQAACCGR